MPRLPDSRAEVKEGISNHCYRFARVMYVTHNEPKD
jgi:hypothetical protein